MYITVIRVPVRDHHSKLTFAGYFPHQALFNNVSLWCRGVCGVGDVDWYLRQRTGGGLHCPHPHGGVAWTGERTTEWTELLHSGREKEVDLSLHDAQPNSTVTQCKQLYREGLMDSSNLSWMTYTWPWDT